MNELVRACLIFLALSACMACGRERRGERSGEVAPQGEPRNAPVASSAAHTEPKTRSSKTAPKSHGVKPPIRGLVSMGAYKFAAVDGEPENSMDTIRKKRGLLQGVVILASWRDLERSATSGLTPNNQIDRGLAEVRKYNAETPTAPLAVKLRVWGGSWAPTWVMDESGGQIQLNHINVHKVSKQRVLGHVWAPAYRKRWARLQKMLAARYDSEPLVREVAVTSCMMFTAEPFSIDTNPESVGPLRKAGMTDAAYKACLDHIVEDYAPWKTTRFETPLNPFKATDGGKPVHDEAFTLAWMKRCHEAEPVRCTFDNHNLDTKLNRDLVITYDAMAKSGAGVEFQTGPAMPEDLEGSIALAVSNGAISVELYQDYKGFPTVPDADLRRYAAMLQQNRPE